jgi:hypothetical protein
VILVAVCVAGLSQDCGPKGTTSDNSTNNV